jgi:TetR/AcrR family acrAB operon transcriptional repressor
VKSDNEEREQRILDAASHLIIHYGYDKTTVSDIAQEAGVSKGAIYLHFDSKDELFEALLLREMMKYSQYWFALLEADPQGGTMAGIYKNVLYALNRNPFMSAIFKQDRRVLGNYIRKPGNLFQTQGSGSMRHEFLKMMQDAGAIRSDIDTKVYAHIMNMLAFALVSMDDVLNPDDIPLMADLIEAIAEIMDRALTPENGADSEVGKAIIRQISEVSKQQFEQMKQPKEE